MATTMPRIDQALLRTVLLHETEDQRFERFAVDLIAADTGQQMLPTAKSWDLGRDGSAGASILAASVARSDPDGKAARDAKRIAETTPEVEAVTFCAPVVFSEQRREQIRRAMREHLGASVEVEVHGVDQIVAMGSRHRELVAASYRVELEDLAQGSWVTSDDSGTLALRLALCTHDNPDATSLKRDLLDALCLHALAQVRPSTLELGQLSARITEQLRLGRQFPTQHVEEALSHLDARSLVERVDSSWRITDSGETVVDDHLGELATASANWRQRIREELEERLGTKLTPDSLEAIWRRLTSGLADLLHRRGVELLTALSDFATTGRVSSCPAPVDAELRSIASDAGVVAVQLIPLQRRIERALQDMFIERSGAAFEFLSATCARYSALCVLGVEPRTAELLKERLSATHLVLDTDVLLSLLCEGEPNHTAVRSLVKHWTRAAGTVTTAESVLEEVAYHAEIADCDFQECKDFLPGGAQDDAFLINNAFVRAFASIGRRSGFRGDQWPRFIRQFRGHNVSDTQKLKRICNRDHSIELLGEGERQDEDLAKRVKQTIIAERIGSAHSNREERIIEDKAARDGRLLASMAKAVRMQDGTQKYYLASSARRLAEVAKRASSEWAEDPPILSIATATAMLMCVPGVKLGLSAMRHLLFDPSPSNRLNVVHRKALRVVRSSSQYDLDFATRDLLTESLDQAIRERAREAGTTTREMKRRFAEERDPELNANVIVTALDAIGKETVDHVRFDRIADENADLKRHVRALERELKQLKST